MSYFNKKKTMIISKILKKHIFLPRTSVKSKENRALDPSSKVLSLDNKNKKLFYFVLCSLNRTFANGKQV